MSSSSKRDMLGVIVGTSLLESELFSELETIQVETEYGSVSVFEVDQCRIIQRHQSPDGYKPPHLINHKSHIQAMNKLKCRKIFSIQSTGSLREEIEPGTLLLPDDFMNLWNVVTFYDDERGHGVAEYDHDLREEVLAALNDDFEPVDGGVYVQTKGPRFETPAEAQFLSDYGDVVGMTSATEAILASEKNISYAALCSVDNYVNGIAGQSITMEKFQRNVEDNLPTVIDAFETVLDSLVMES